MRYVNSPWIVASWKSAVTSLNTKGTSVLLSGTCTITALGTK